MVMKYNTKAEWDFTPLIHFWGVDGLKNGK